MNDEYNRQVKKEYERINKEYEETHLPEFTAGELVNFSGGEYILGNNYGTNQAAHIYPLYIQLSDTHRLNLTTTGKRCPTDRNPAITKLRRLK